jgi:hypothetical protein
MFRKEEGDGGRDLILAQFWRFLFEIF